MKKIVLILFVFIHCIVVEERPIKLSIESDKKISQVSAFITPPRTLKSRDNKVLDCYENTKQELNYNKIFSAKNATYFIDVSCSMEDGKYDTTDYLMGVAAVATLWIFPMKLNMTRKIDIELTQNRDKIAAYKYENVTSSYISWVLFPFGVYQILTTPNYNRNHDNFLKNVNLEIYEKIISYNKILEERRIVKLEEDTKAKEQENIKLEAERKELEEKLKTVKTSMLQVGSAYCLEESYILGITYTTNEDILPKLIFAQVCFEVEDKPLAAKLIPYDKGVYVYVDSQKFYSSKKLLKVK